MVVTINTINNNNNNNTTTIVPTERNSLPHTNQSITNPLTNQEAATGTPPLPSDQMQSNYYMTITWLNIRGLRSKDELLVRKASQPTTTDKETMPTLHPSSSPSSPPSPPVQWPLVLLTETKLAREHERLFTGNKNEWTWYLGTGTSLTSMRSAPTKGGVGALIHCSIIASVKQLYSDRHQLWLQLAPRTSGDKPTIVGVAYLPCNTNPAARKKRKLIYANLSTHIRQYQAIGHVLVGGDFNARIAANGDAVNNTEGNQLKEFADDHRLTIANTMVADPVNNHGPRVIGKFTRTELCGSKLLQSTVDYVLVSKQSEQLLQHLTLVDDVAARVNSDHHPLVIKWKQSMPVTAANNTQQQTRRRWCVERITASAESIQKYREDMQKYMKQWHSQATAWLASEASKSLSSPHELISHLLSEWELSLTDGVTAAVGTKQVRPYSKSWMSRKLVDMMNNRNELRHRCEQTPATQRHDDNAQWMLLIKQTMTAQIAVRMEIRRSKRAQQERLYEEIERQWRCPKLFYKLAKNMRDTNPITAPSLLDTGTGELVSDIDARLKVARDHYERLGRDERSHIKDQSVDHTSASYTAAVETNNSFDEEFATSIEKKLKCILEDDQPDEGDVELNAEFTALELLAATRKLCNGKATGADTIHSEFLRYGGEAMQASLLLLFNTVWSLEQWPDRWSLGLIHPIYKRSGDVTDLDNHRPITLLSCVSKLFEIVLNNRLTQWAERKKLLSDEQCGFRSKRGCADQLFILQEIWTSRREQKKSTFVAFLDVKSAYDRVWHNGMWVRLHAAGIRGKPWRMLRAMYEKIQRTVLVSGKRTLPFLVQVGVSQGSVLSPFLYSVFIDGLIHHLKSNPRWGVEVTNRIVASLLYADDIALIADTAEQLQEMLDAVSEYAHQWRFHFNPKKSHVVLYGTPTEIDHAKQIQWRLDGHEITTVDEYKYLGMQMGKRPAAYTSFATGLVHKAKCAACELLYCGCDADQLNAKCSVRLWKSLVRPILEYAAETWIPNHEQVKSIESVQVKFARRVLGSTPTAPAVFVTSELGLHSLAYRRDLLILRYWRRLCATSSDRLIHQLFISRVTDVKRDPLHCRSSLCSLFMKIMQRYNMQEQWETMKTNEIKIEEWIATTALVCLCFLSSLNWLQNFLYIHAGPTAKSFDHET